MLWKIYFVIMIILIVLSSLAFGQATHWHSHIVDELNMLFMIIGEVGVFGYAYRRRIWTTSFWLVFFVITLAYQLAYSFYLDQHYGAAPVATTAGGLVTFVPLIPMYIAIALYSRSKLLD